VSLVDGVGRSIDYLRLSVTDRCDFRCVYCMAKNMTFLPRQQVLTLEELQRLAALFVGRGVRKIRLTGGEPLIRPGIVGLCRTIAALPGLRELVMTSNGSQLARLARPLVDAGVKRMNISLDSLDADRFRAITRNGDLRQVLDGIEAARTRVRAGQAQLRGDERAQLRRGAGAGAVRHRPGHRHQLHRGNAPGDDGRSRARRSVPVMKCAA
jgi:cyclic pyranopterin phosphate synthase